MEFCNRPSRLLSGEPGALFTPDSGRFQVSQTLTQALSSPFQYQLNSQQVPDTVFWHITKCNVVFFSGFNGLSNLETQENAIRLFLNTNQNVGSKFTNNGAPSGIVQQNVGLELKKITAEQVNGPFPQAEYTLEFEAPFDIPPKWFLSLAILDLGSGPNLLRAGDSITIDTVRQIIPADFYKNY
jgi:hypothetical protein